MKLRQLTSVGVIALVLCMGNAIRGQNLLPNPGFETYSGCPSSVAQMYLATGWNNPSGHSGSADFIHTCGSSSLVQVPGNAFGSQTPHAGNAYMGFALFYQSTPGFREYIYCQLAPPLGLTAGQAYTVSWWVSCGDNSSMATDDLQFYFSNAAPTWGGNWNAMTTYTPQCAIPSGTYITNKAGWTQISATFTASGGERFMTMGNFLLDGATSVIGNGGGTYNTGYVYYDDGTLLPSVILSAEVQALEAVAQSQSVKLAWETRSEVANDRFEIERSVADYNHFESIGSLPAAGNSSQLVHYAFEDAGYTPGAINYYRLRAMDQNGTAAYSNAVGVETMPKGTHFVNCHPNPAQTGMPIQLTLTLEVEQPVDVVLIDLQGREVRELRFDGQSGLNKLDFPTNGLEAGQYLMRAKCGTEQTVRRITLL